MTRILLPLALALLSLRAWCGPVGPDEALGLARGFFASRDASLRKAASAARRDAARCRIAGETPAAFVVGLDSDFVLISRDDTRPAVLGYGTGRGPLPANLRAMLAGAVPAAGAPTGSRRPVGPLLTAVRHQKAPYNSLCPYYTDETGTSRERTVVGCVATAAEEVISHYRRTVTLRDTLHGWTTDHYTIADALPGEQVDCRLIADDYDTGTHTPEAVDAVARLSLWCGMAARMNYGLSESGARVSRLAEPFRRALGFGYVHHCDSYQYAPEDWRRMLDGELDAARPVLYAGRTQHLGGHAFVVDGRDADGLYHLNWGYGGNYDGYFRLDVLCPFEPASDYTPGSVAASFFCDQEMLLLHPDAQTTALPDTLERTGREFEVTGLRPLLPAETRIHTPLELSLRNTGRRRLTTSFMLFTNLPADTALLAQADGVATTGVTLEAGADTTLTVHARFNEPGRRVLRISADGRSMLAAVDVDVAERAGASTLACARAEVRLEGDTARVRVTWANGGDARFGEIVTHTLHEGVTATTAEPRTHYTYPYIPAGSRIDEEIRYLRLEPGKTYTAAGRLNGRGLYGLTFTMPAVTGIGAPGAGAAAPAPRWLTLDGRPVAAPRGPGLYLRRQGAKTAKVYVPAGRQPAN